MTGNRLAAAVLGATLAIQVYASVAASATAVLAPAIAATFAVEAGWIGVFVGLVYAGGMCGSLASGGFIERYGAIRTSQACVVLCAAGTALIAAAPAGAPWLLALAALVIGLGYGPITPASSQLLARTAPPGRMAITFSIKQTGVPAGAALAGALLPTLASGSSWRGALGWLALAALPVLVCAEPIRARLDAERRRARLSLRSAVAPLGYLRTPALRQLALTSLAYSATQVSLTSFLVVYLTGTLRYPLVAAGLVLAAATIGGVAGRIGWGVVADRWLAPRTALATIGLAAALLSLALALAHAGWGAAVVVFLCVALGATAIGWNGVQLAEVARLAPPGMAGPVTGAVGFVTFSGVVIGPPLFAAIASLTGSYRVSFAVMACVSAGSAVWLWRAATPAGDALWK
jgi:MFS family permease